MSNKSKRRDLTQGSLKKAIFAMTIPMTFGMLGMVIFNFVDSLYVGMLGQVELAAISFTFPVVLVIMSITQGIGIGTGTMVSKYIGEKDEDKVKKSSTYSLILGVIFVIIICLVGFLTMNPLFRALGATKNEMPHIISYMRVYYLGVPFVVIPMVGNNIIRALGDTKIPSLAMTIAAILNIALDPLFIFGWGFEGLGITGAALATVISRFTTLLFTLWILIRREKVITFKNLSISEFLGSSKKLLKVAVPTGAARSIIPLGAGVITAMIAVYGSGYVAGYGAGVKIENLAVCVSNALSTVMVAVVGQNFGAKDFGRIKKSYNIACVYSLLYTLIAVPLIFIAGPYLANLFDVDNEVRLVMIKYVRVAIFGIGFLGIIAISSSVLNAINKPFKAAIIFFVYMFGIYVPLAKILSIPFSTYGIFYAALIAYIVSGVISYIVTIREINCSRLKYES